MINTCIKSKQCVRRGVENPESHHNSLYEGSKGKKTMSLPQASVLQHPVKNAYVNAIPYSQKSFHPPLLALKYGLTILFNAVLRAHPLMYFSISWDGSFIRSLLKPARHKLEFPAVLLWKQMPTCIFYRFPSLQQLFGCQDVKPQPKATKHRRGMSGSNSNHIGLHRIVNARTRWPFFWDGSRIRRLRDP